MLRERIKESDVRSLVAALAAAAAYGLESDELDLGWRLARARHVVTGDGYYFRYYAEEGFWYDLGWASDGRRDTNRFSTLAELAAAHPKPRPFMTGEEALERYPRLAAHLICESLGYFTPTGAGNAIANHFNRRPHYCEYYDHCSGAQTYRDLARRMSHEAVMLRVGQDRLAWAYRSRQSHHGFMADYGTAAALVRQANEGSDRTMLASWF